jgi:hypothetical protein
MELTVNQSVVLHAGQQSFCLMSVATALTNIEANSVAHQYELSGEALLFLHA